MIGKVLTKNTQSFTSDKVSKSNYVSNGRSCCLDPVLNFRPQCQEVYTTFLSSNWMHENRTWSPVQKWVPLPVVNISDWAGLMCRCLQPRAKLQHHLEAGLALPYERASFPEHLSVFPPHWISAYCIPWLRATQIAKSGKEFLLQSLQHPKDFSAKSRAKQLHKV